MSLPDVVIVSGAARRWPSGSAASAGTACRAARWPPCGAGPGSVAGPRGDRSARAYRRSASTTRHGQRAADLGDRSTARGHVALRRACRRMPRLTVNRLGGRGLQSVASGARCCSWARPSWVRGRHGEHEPGAHVLRGARPASKLGAAPARDSLSSRSRLALRPVMAQTSDNCPEVRHHPRGALISLRTSTSSFHIIR